MKTLWLLFIAGQILNAGNMNYQQDIGMYEINPIYGKHPTKEIVYAMKTAECVGLYGLTKTFPKHKKAMLIVANIIVWGMLYYDHNHAGVALNFRF